MKMNRQIMAVVAIGLAACTPGDDQSKEQPASEQRASGKPAGQSLAVAMETTPSASDSAAAAVAWPGSGGYIIGAIEDGLELYGPDGQTLGHAGGGEIEAISLIGRYGDGDGPLALALDTSVSQVNGFVVRDGALVPTQQAIVKTDALLEGMCAYTSPLDGESYAFLLTSSGQIEQWAITKAADGTLKSRLTRKLQVGSEPKFCVADSKRNNLYVTEEAVGVWRFDADVEADTVPELIDVVKFGHFTGEVGGLALHHTAAGQTVLFASDVESSMINLYDVEDDHRFIGQTSFKAAGSVDGVDNAGALSAGGGYLALADEDNGDDATNFKLVSMTTIADAFGFSKLKASEGEDPTAKFALVKPSLETAPVADGGDAADDPAIWVHPTDPAKSLIIGTNKQGGLYSYTLDGKVHQYLEVGRVNNVDVRYGVKLGDRTATIAVASNRTHESIDIFEIDDATGMMTDIADGVQPTNMPDPYGLCLYQSPKDGSTYVFINEKDGLVRQWKLEDGTSGRMKTTQVREFEVGSTAEGCTADDDTGALFVAEEDVALWKYGAEPADGDAREKITDPRMNPALKDDLEGVSIYYGEGTKGYIVLSSQGNNSYALFDREAPHAYIGSYRVIADSDAGIDGSSETDGLDIISTPLGAQFPYGVFVAQDGRNIAPDEKQNFKLVPWQRIADEFSLEKYTGRDPRK